MAQEQRSPAELRDLVERIVETILGDEELAGALGGRLAVGRQRCPKNHKCERNKFTCNRPFTCPNMHNIVWVPL